MFFSKKKKKKKKKKNHSTMARKLVAATDTTSIISEQFRTIRTNITFSMPDQDTKTILVTSSTPGEGKSTNAANIGVVYAQEGKRVLMVDADMRKPTLHHTFTLLNNNGLSNVLTMQKAFYDVIQETSVAGLYVITSGPIPPNPSELLASKQIDILMIEVAKDFDIIIFDAPPLLSVTDAQILAKKCDGTLLIVNTGVVEKANVLKAKASLTASQAKIIGVVLNNFALKSEHNYFQYYGSTE